MQVAYFLRANAVLTAACASVAVGGAQTVATITALQSHYWSVGLGVLLAAYVPVLLVAAHWPVRWLIRTIVALDVAYVCIALAYYCSRWTQLDLPGAALVMGPAAFVGLLAVLQAIAISCPNKTIPA